MSYYSIKPMTYPELDQILAWRNHSKIRKIAENSDKISVTLHRKWYMNSPAIKLGFRENDVLVGVVIFDERDYWSFYLDPKLRSDTGLGRIMLALALKYAKLNNFPFIKAHVKIDNKRSITLHRELGFMELSRSDDIIEYKKELL